MESITIKESYSFLRNGGEMGRLTRAYDWSDTVLGNPSNWPQSLRTTLSILLNSKFPMFLFWGRELICFYNDAYRPSLGNNGKHPWALGKRGEEVWPEIWADIKPLIDQVLAGGEASWSEDQLLPIYRNGKMEDVYWTFSYSPVNDESGHPAGVFVTCTETTEKYLGAIQLAENREQLQFTIDAAELATWDINLLTTKFISNNRLKEWFGIAPIPETGLDQGLNTIFEADRDKVKKAVEFAIKYESGGLYDIEYRINADVGKQRSIRSKGQVFFNEEKIAYRFVGTMQDITAQVIAHHEMEANEQYLRNIILKAPVGLCIVGGSPVKVEIVNDLFLQIIGKERNAIENLPYWEVLEEAAVYYAPILEEVFRTGIPYHAHEHKILLIRKDQKEFVHINFVYDPIKEPDGSVKRVIILAIDVSQQVAARTKIEESEQRVRSVVETAPFPIGVYVGREMKIELANQAILDVFGKGNDVIGKSYLELLPELNKQEIFQQLDLVFTTGVPFQANNRRVDIDVNGKMQPYYFNYSFKPLFDASGKVYGVMNTGADVTDLNVAKLRLEESERNLNNIILQAPVAMCIFRGKDYVVKIANERMFELWGRSADEVMNKPIFEALPEIKNQGFEEILNNVFTTGKTFAGNGLPITLPRDGKIEIVYVKFVYEPINEPDGSISGIMAVAIEVTDQVLARQKIEELVAQRTKELAAANEALIHSNQELARSNVNLEEFAYAASHDMKEPIRKIHFFSDRIKHSLAERFTPEELRYFGRMEEAANRMKSLIDDLLSYSQVSMQPRISDTVDLNHIIKQVLHDLELEIEEKKAHINLENLPIIKGHRRQLQQAFQNLLSNALKFHKPGEPNIINIECKKVYGYETAFSLSPEQKQQYYYLITITDNGIGFDQQNAERIFNVFTRLQGNAEYRGTGIGLSIVRKVAENHNGFVSALSEIGKGSSFHLLLPTE